MKKGFVVLGISVFILFAGCAVTSNYTYSKPDAKETSPIKKGRGRYASVFDANGFQFTITPYNKRMDDQTLWLTLVPIPTGSSDDNSYVSHVRFGPKSKRAEAPFVVEIGILATRGDLSLDLSRMSLEVEGKRVAPTSMVSMSDFICEKEFGRIYYLSPCRLGAYPPHIETLETMTIGMDEFKYIWLVFDVQPPPPENLFSMEIDGLSISGRNLPAVRIDFSADADSHGEAVM
jgi:hypothetical protein